MARDEFLASTRELMARRVGYMCSNPSCRSLTIGPKEGEVGAMKVGIAAHITAAEEGGPRYDPSLTHEQRKDIDNGIWLCVKCATIIDRDEKKYTVELLHEWKRVAEKWASEQLLSSGSKDELTTTRIYVKEWVRMPSVENMSMNDSMNIMFVQSGGSVKSGDRWINYIDGFEDWEKPYIEAIRLDVVNRGIKMTGKECHESEAGVPKFNNGKVGLFTYRAWGDLMAAIWSEEENKNYSYMDFYM